MSTTHEASKSPDATKKTPKPPKPRRLFSFDSVRSAASNSSRRTASSDFDETAPRGPRHMNPLELSNVQEGDGEQEGYTDPFNSSSGEPWIPAADQTLSPIGVSLSSPPLETKRSSSRLEPIRPVSVETTKSNPSQFVTLPTNKLWDNLRHHVLTPPIPPSTPPSSVISHASTPHTVRTTTPKPSRLAKFGFKHVVEGARVIQDDTRRFGEEILRACSIARSGEINKSSKDPSTTSLNSNGTGGATAAGAKRLDYLRRPVSIASLSNPNTLQSGLGASLRYLYQILVYHAGVVTDTNATQHLSANLPHEARVLSTLLCPFLLPSRYPMSRVEEEQTTAVEAFELLSKSWTPIDETAVVERCLWCTKAASSIPPHPTRTRILGSLWRLLVPTDRPKTLLTAQGFQSLSSGLILLLVALYKSGIYQGADISNRPYGVQTNNSYHPDVILLKEVIENFLVGSLGDLEDDSVEEEYGAEYSAADRKDTGRIRRAVFLDALVNCLENSSVSRLAIFENVVDEYWVIPSDSVLTNLQAAVYNRRINTFCRFALIHIHPFVTGHPLSVVPQTPRTPSSSSLQTLGTQPNETRSISRTISILQTRIIPESEIMEIETNLDPQVVLQTKTHIASILLDVLRFDDGGAPSRTTSSGEDVFGGTHLNGAQGGAGVEQGLKECVHWATNTLARWYRAGSASPWREVLENTLRQVITGGWQTAVPVLFALFKQLPDDIKKAIFASVLPIVNDQLVEDPPACPSPELSSFLSTISRSLPLIFYKPLFACAYSDQEVIVVNHLCTIQVHSKYIKDYWVRDVEMLCVALLSDVGIARGNIKDGKWGVVRLGQMVLLVELIGRIQVLRIEREAMGSGSDTKFIEVIRFVTALESRLWQTIETREAKLLMPSSQRMLFCLLFRELRLFTRSLKPAPWLSPTLHWFDVFCADEHIGDLEQEVTDTVQRVQGLYMAAQEGVQQSHKRHTTMLATSVLKTPTTETIDNQRLDLAATFVEHRKLIDSLSKGYISRSMKLFVAMSTLISTVDYQLLGPLLWQYCLLENADLSATSSACFLIMQCAEKTPSELLPAIEIDLHASDDMTRLEAVRKVAVLVNWRFQITTQNFLTDRAHRPFKLGRPPLPFIATDIGSSLYIHVEDINQNKDSDQVPLELKKRLAELGWVEEDASGEDPRHELIQTPLSILPPNQMERMEVGTADIFANPLSPPSPLSSPRRPRPARDQNQQQLLQPLDDVSALLRRNSSSGGPSSGIKRRPVFVPTLSLIFRHLAALVFDNNFVIASAARKTVLDLMRNDPALLIRSILDFLAGENKDMVLAISTFSYLLHVKRTLPPPLTHYIFNNLAGFLKQIAKNIEGGDSLNDFAQVVPVLTDLAIQVSGMSVREVRRSKMEHIFIPSGSLWFPQSAPKGPMFPRNAGDTHNPFEPLPARLLPISMIRVSQNLFFFSMLQRNYKDVQAIRKHMSRLVLPSLDDYAHVKNLELKDFLPRKDPARHHSSMQKDGTVEVLSLMVARSYILLVAQIFRSMPRHLGDRHELAVLVDGLNRCLLSHDDDINIISQVLIALMVASTRFRRMFLAGGGYTLFMPTIAKIYVEKPSHPGIRAAIEYAIGRFYALHKESFLYQCINIIGQIAILPVDTEWFSRGIFDMFSSLRKGSTNPAADMGGIHNVNRAEEREALILHTADETPQTFLSSIRRGDSQTNYQMSFELPEEYESSRLGMDNLVRLFLTVIAHDLTITRAQHFLRLLRFLSPHLYNASGSSRNVLSDGITALGMIFTRAFAKPKGGGELPKPQLEEEDKSFLSAAPGLENLSNDAARTPGDSTVMRLDFLLLVLAFGQAGGQVSLLTARQAIDVTKSLLKDWPEGVDTLTSFLRDFVKMLLNREETPTAKGVVAFLQEIAPVFHAFMTTDFSGVLECIIKLTQVPLYNHDLAFSQVIVGEICTAGLAACDLLASENQLMNLPYRPILVSLLAEAIFLRGVDIIGEIEKRAPTHHFLAAIVLPLTLAMKTNAQIIIDSTRTDAHRNALISAWVRLLFYAMAACQKSRRDDDDVRNAFKGITGSFRTKWNNSRKQEGSFWRSHLPTFMLALQIIKVIVTRGADDISARPQLGIWERLGTFFRTMLAEGSAEFALRPEPSSAVTTPTASPRASTQIDPSSSGTNLFISTSSDLNPPSSPRNFNGTPKFYSRPRLIDYTLWSMLEFVCAYRSPLRMQLKLLTMEKLIALDQELGQQGVRRPYSSVSLSPVPNSPSSRRISASIGSKARQRASGVIPSPDSSPYLMPTIPSGLSPSPINILPSGLSTQSLSLPNHLPPSISLSPSMLEIPATNPRRPGYAISPVSPDDRQPGRPKIVHLGPTSPALTSAQSPLVGARLRRYSRAVSPSRRESQAESTISTTKTKATKVKSAHLIKETYRRIRGIQVFMGFSDLLPLSGSVHPTDDERELAALETWTKAQTLTSIAQETEDLMEEFEETFAPGEESIMVEVEPSTPVIPAS